MVKINQSDAIALAGALAAVTNPSSDLGQSSANLQAVFNQIFAISKIYTANVYITTPYVTSMTVGKQYVIWDGDFQAGDDFSNTGFEALDQAFICTDATPLVWTNETSVVEINISIVVLQNTFSSTVSLEFVDGSDWRVVFSDPELTDALKIFLIPPSNANWAYNDANSLNVTNMDTNGQVNALKIEQYV